MVESGTYYHSTGDTPSVRPFGLPAPPPGSQVQPPLKGEEGASRRRGQARYAEYHLEYTGANSYTPLGFPRGCCKAQRSRTVPAQSHPPPWLPRGEAGSPLGLTEEGRRQPKCCLHPVQWYQPKIIADYISLFKFIYHIENGSYKTSALPHSLNPLRNFWCTPSLISHAPYGARQLPPGGSQGGLYEFARALIKP